MTETKIGAREAFRAQPVLLVADRNPKKRGSMSYERFEGYFDIDWSQPQTVGSVLAGRVVRMDDIRHDNEHGYIVVGAAAIEAHKEQAKLAREAAIEAAKALLAEVEEETETEGAE